MHRRGRVILLLAVAAAPAGCHYGQPFVSPPRLDRGLVLMFTGIEGRSPFNEEIVEGLALGGVDYAIELVDWTTGLSPLALAHLRMEARNRAKAEDIAQKVARYRMSHPGKPVYLVGQSGGGAIAVWVAEALPPGVDVDGIVLLAATLSPEYRLDLALLNSRQGIVSFHSNRDWLFLGAGTTVAGTMDGKHTASAGKIGFAAPQPTPALYRRLYEVPWTEAMEQTGYSGGHLRSGARGFVAAYVAPLLKTRYWSREAVDPQRLAPPTASQPRRTPPPAGGGR